MPLERLAGNRFSPVVLILPAVSVQGQAALTGTGAETERPSLCDTCCDNMSTVTADVGSIQEMEREFIMGQT